MIYDLVHTTSYTYEDPVDLAQCVLRHQTMDQPGQRVVASVLNLSPQPRSQSYGHDFFGNRVAHLTFSGLHESLVIEARARIVVEPPAVPAQTPAWESVRSIAAVSTDLSGRSPVHFLFASPHVPLIAAARGLVAPLAQPQLPILALATSLSDHIHDSFTYDPDATEVSTPIAASILQRRGVCQDFAHVMIACLRAMGLPAAYASGYLRTYPPPGRPRLVGADASHAWVMVWCGQQAGWIGIDPTNRRMAGADHILLAIGRDYDDIAPVSGRYRTSGGQKLKVSVDVAEAA